MPDGTALAECADFDLLSELLAADIQESLAAAIREHVVFLEGADPLSVFRAALRLAVRDIEEHPRGLLLQRFLRDGPYESEGEIPTEMVGKRLSDDETARAISFISGHMVKCFQGSLAELLALAPCLRILSAQVQRLGIPAGTRLYVGDTVLAPRAGRPGFAKAADMHFLSDSQDRTGAAGINVAGVVEVKSYVQSLPRFDRQLEGHVARLRRGMSLLSQTYDSGAVHIGIGPSAEALRVAVQPSAWTLPRAFRFEMTDRGRELLTDPVAPPASEDRIEETGPNAWRVTLRWSQEALAAAAYDMTFWYMERVGEVLYGRGQASPWPEKSAAAAGANAVKQGLYYAILRCRTRREQERAIALYNTYGFGYALGMNFVNGAGRRDMLWPQDLDEIAADGRTKHGCRLR